MQQSRGGAVGQCRLRADWQYLSLQAYSAAPLRLTMVVAAAATAGEEEGTAATAAATEEGIRRPRIPLHQTQARTTHRQTIHRRTTHRRRCAALCSLHSPHAFHYLCLRRCFICLCKNLFPSASDCMQRYACRLMTVLWSCRGTTTLLLPSPHRRATPPHSSSTARRRSRHCSAPFPWPDLQALSLWHALDGRHWACVRLFHFSCT